MLDDALAFPRTADDWMQTVVIGGVLGLLGVLILPGMVVQGYLLRVVRGAVDDETAPSFTDWADLLVDGFRLFVLQLGVALVLVVPLGVLIGVAGLFGASPGGREIGAVVLLLGLLAFGALALAVAYLLPAAVANFAIEDSLGAALDVGTVLDGARTSDYAVAWLLAAFVGIVGGLVGSALSVVFVGVFVLFYVQVVVYYLFGRGFAAGLGRGAWGGGGASATRTDIGRTGGPKSDASNRPAGGRRRREREGTSDGTENDPDQR